MVRIAALSDIHGNRWALEAVLADLEQRNVRELVNLGDSLYGPLDPAGTARLLAGLRVLNVRGNEDALILAPYAAAGAHPTLRHVRESLTAKQLDWLASHRPQAVAAGRLFLCHGTPRADSEYLLEVVGPGRAGLRGEEELARLLAGVPQLVVLCGHSHVPRVVQLRDGRLVVNCGSVGLPAYHDDEPVPHEMETGSPHARYAILEERAAGWCIQDVVVPYDCEAAARAAEATGRPDWAAWLRTGRAATWHG